MRDYSELVKNLKFKRDIHNTVIELYEMVINKDIMKFPNKFWDSADSELYAGICTRYLVEDILKYDTLEKKKTVTLDDFKNNELRGMMRNLFGNSIFKVMDNAYPNTFNPITEFKVPYSYWDKYNSRKIIQWLLEDKLKLSIEDIPKVVRRTTFYNNGLMTMLRSVYNDSVYEAINDTYPDRFKPWDFRYIGHTYWDKHTAREATRWLIEEKLKIDPKEAIRVLKRKQFYDNGLNQMLHSLFEDNPCLAVLNAYPELCKKYIAFRNI